MFSRFPKGISYAGSTLDVEKLTMSVEHCDILQPRIVQDLVVNVCAEEAHCCSRAPVGVCIASECVTCNFHNGAGR